MANVFDVAKYILEKQGELSTWKLQKLTYYSQAWALAWTGKPLFEEDFEAWSNGPVCPELFRQHKGKYSICSDDLKKGSPDNLTPDEIDTINIVLKDYGDMEPFELRELTHREKPWINARGNLPDGIACSNTICKETIGEYYGSL